jgi:hypothetical protein
MDVYYYPEGDLIVSVHQSQEDQIPAIFRTVRSEIKGFHLTPELASKALKLENTIPGLRFQLEKKLA